MNKSTTMDKMQAMQTSTQDEMASKELQNTSLRSDSGDVTSDDRLVAFIYELLRDHITAGCMEALAQRVEHTTGTVVYTNGFIAEYAKNIAKRLK